MHGPDLPALATGLAIVALGTVLLLDRIGELDLDFGSATPSLLATIGIVLVAAGMAKRDMSE